MLKLLRNSLLLLFVYCIATPLALCHENNINGAQNFVQATSDKVVNLVAHAKSEGKTEQTLDSIFLNVTEIDWIGKYVIGNQWRSLDNTQKAAYLTQYRKYLTSLYVPLFKDYNGQKITIKGGKELGTDQYLVTTEIQPNDTGKSKYKVEYRLRFANGEFKIRDIIVEDVSMIATQRANFSSLLSRSGFPSLMSALEQKEGVKVSE